MEQVIRDNMGQRLGSIVDTGEGQEARNPMGCVLARYIRSGNKTVNTMGTKLAEGNVLASFIMR